MWGKQGKRHSHAYKVGIAMGRAALRAGSENSGKCGQGVSVRYGPPGELMKSV